MQLSSLNNIRTRVLILLAVLSLVLTACDAIASPPEDEEATYDGAPVVTISSPLNGESYQEGVGVNILLRVENAGPDVARVAIQVDGVIIGEAILPNPNGDPGFTVSNGWPATGEGSHTISAVASRSDGTVSETASVTINVIASAQSDTSSGDAGQDSSADDNNSDTTEDTSDETEEPAAEAPTEEEASAQEAATLPPLPTAVPTNTPQPTPVPPTATPATPQILVTTGANVRSGPGQVFDIIGSLAANARADILAISTTGTWYKIQYYNGDGWISDLVVNVEGNISSLPREAGPPTPIPATATPAATAVPPTAASNVDLFIDGARSSFVPTFVCNQPSTITITVVNQGTEASANTNILIEDIHPDGSVGANTETAIGSLQPGESGTATAVLTVSSYINEAHTFRARVDANGSVAESNENNNTWSAIYILEPGGC